MTVRQWAWEGGTWAELKASVIRLAVCARWETCGSTLSSLITDDTEASLMWSKTCITRPQAPSFLSWCNSIWAHLNSLCWIIYIFSLRRTDSCQKHYHASRIVNKHPMQANAFETDLEWLHFEMNVVFTQVLSIYLSIYLSIIHACVHHPVKYNTLKVIYSSKPAAISLRLQGKLSFPYNCQKMNGQIYVLLC